MFRHSELCCVKFTNRFVYYEMYDKIRLLSNYYNMICMQKVAALEYPPAMEPYAVAINQAADAIVFNKYREFLIQRMSKINSAFSPELKKIISKRAKEARKRAIEIFNAALAQLNIKTIRHNTSFDFLDIFKNELNNSLSDIKMNNSQMRIINNIFNEPVSLVFHKKIIT